MLCMPGFWLVTCGCCACIEPQPSLALLQAEYDRLMAESVRAGVPQDGLHCGGAPTRLPSLAQRHIQLGHLESKPRRKAAATQAVLLRCVSHNHRRQLLPGWTSAFCFCQHLVVIHLLLGHHILVFMYFHSGHCSRACMMALAAPRSLGACYQSSSCLADARSVVRSVFINSSAMRQTWRTADILSCTTMRVPVDEMQQLTRCNKLLAPVRL